MTEDELEQYKNKLLKETFKRMHVSCAGCFATHFPDRGPVAVRNTGNANCCFCGNVTADGIYLYYVRDTPPPCKGEHSWDNE